MANCYSLSVIATLLYALIWRYGLANQERPIIGVLTQKNTYSEEYPYGDTYLFSSYVKYLEQAGAGVVPILMSQEEEYYSNLFNKINGVLFPGGGVNVTNSPFAKVGQFFFEKAKQSNEKGDYFPLWGTCLGFEMLAVLAAEEDILQQCHADNILMPLHFSAGSRKSRLFEQMTDPMTTLLSQQNITNNHHVCCVTSKVFDSNKKLKSFYKVLSTNTDKNGVEFISTMEAYQYPFYAVQWHPEKNAFVYDVHQNINHSAEAITATQYFANFFVEEARKSRHMFVSEKEQVAELIDNYHPIFLGYPFLHSAYFFNDTSNQNHLRQLALYRNTYQVEKEEDN